MKIRNYPHWKQFSSDLQQYNEKVKLNYDGVTIRKYEIYYNGCSLLVTRYEPFIPGLVPAEYGLEFNNFSDTIVITKYMTNLRKIFNAIHKLYKKQRKEELSIKQRNELSFVEEKLFGIKPNQENNDV